MTRWDEGPAHAQSIKHKETHFMAITTDRTVSNKAIWSFARVLWPKAYARFITDGL